MKVCTPRKWHYLQDTPERQTQCWYALYNESCLRPATHHLDGSTSKLHYALCEYHIESFNFGGNVVTPIGYAGDEEEWA